MTQHSQKVWNSAILINNTKLRNEIEEYVKRGYRKVGCRFGNVGRQLRLSMRDGTCPLTSKSQLQTWNFPKRGMGSSFIDSKFAYSKKYAKQSFNFLLNIQFFIWSSCRWWPCCCC